MQRDPLGVFLLDALQEYFHAKTKQKTKQKKCSKQKTLKVEAANDSVMKEKKKTTHIYCMYHSSVLLLRCQSVEVRTFTHP